MLSLHFPEIRTSQHEVLFIVLGLPLYWTKKCCLEPIYKYSQNELRLARCLTATKLQTPYSCWHPVSVLLVFQFTQIILTNYGRFTLYFDIPRCISQNKDTCIRASYLTTCSQARPSLLHFGSHWESVLDECCFLTWSYCNIHHVGKFEIRILTSYIVSKHNQKIAMQVLTFI